MIRPLQHLPIQARLLIPWVITVGMLAAMCSGIYLAGISSVQSDVIALEHSWLASRATLAQHVQASKSRHDVNTILASTPQTLTFETLSMTLSEMARQSFVHVQDLSYHIQPADLPETKKALFHVTVSGRYEDIRQFLSRIEGWDQTFYLSTMELLASTPSANQVVTLQSTLVVYLREMPKKDSRS